MSKPIFNRLISQELIETIGDLETRIETRLPGRNLSLIAADVRRVAAEAAHRCHRIRRPNVPLRIVIGLLLTLMISVLLYAIGYLHFTDAGAWEMLEGVDAAISSTVFLGAAIITAITLENRIKRRKVLDAVHELRVLAHIIDMHQLAKDPDMLIQGKDQLPERVKNKKTSVDPENPTANDVVCEPLTPFLVGRYLDYCSELLSLIGKIAVVYVQDFQDPVVLTAVDEIEHLTTALSRKIWQKIMILNQIVSADDGP
jgi:hypothetical protein